MWPVLSQQLYLVPVCRKERQEVTATAVRSSCKESELQNLQNRTAHFPNASARQSAWKGEPGCRAETWQTQKCCKEREEVKLSHSHPYHNHLCMLLGWGGMDMDEEE